MNHVHSARRRGAFMAPLILCLIAVAMVSAEMLRLVSAQRRESHHADAAAQAAALADSGLDRAQARVARDAAYRGETWEIPSEHLAHRGAARVEIAVVERDGSLEIAARAVFPLESGEETNRTRRISRRSFIPRHSRDSRPPP